MTSHNIEMLTYQVEQITKTLLKLKLPITPIYREQKFKFKSVKNRILHNFRLVQHITTGDYIFFIKRAGNYYKNDFKTGNKSYNIWNDANEYENFKKGISDIKKKYGNNNNFNLKLYHLCIPIELEKDCIYHMKELKDIHSELTIDYIEQSDYIHKSNNHGCDFFNKLSDNKFSVYGIYDWNYIDNLNLSPHMSAIT